MLLIAIRWMRPFIHMHYDRRDNSIALDEGRIERSG